MAMESIAKQVIIPNGNDDDEKHEEEIHNGNSEALATLDHEVYIKHPLHHTWVMWYFKQEKGRDWSDSQRKIAAVSTAEDFWALYNFIQPASKITIGCDYSLFKEGIQPMWEDEGNRKGGRWLLSLDKRMRTNELEAYWLESLLCLIGEAFEDQTDDICGAVVNIRNKGDKIGLWTKDCQNKFVNMAIGRTFKSRLNLVKDGLLEYQSHHDSSSKTGSMAKIAYSI